MLYFTEEEKERNRTRDPIEAFKKRALERELLTEEQIAEADSKVAEIIEEAVNFAEESAWPDNNEVFTDVYVKYP
jgi:pyruvate dehydrogenase E1 component alpha subunit